jgi:hypothetical protein
MGVGTGTRTGQRAGARTGAVQARELGHILVSKQYGKVQTNVQINHIVLWDKKYAIQRDHMVVVPLASIPELEQESAGCKSKVGYIK